MARRSFIVDGFRFAGIHSGIKKTGLDLGAIVADAACPTAAVVTKNRVRAAPVTLCAKRVRRGMAQAVLVNSGNANAATGPQGMADAIATSSAFGGALGIRDGHILPCSTGVIGVPLPQDRMVDAMPRLADALTERADDFAEAILTTDRGTKVRRVDFQVRGRSYRVLGIAKGAGMIHPNMATTLAFAVTDAPIAHDALRAALRSATDKTFNRITVDGDTSTNDTIIAMSSPSGRTPLSSTRAFESALTESLGALAEMIVADGEGAEHVAEIHVVGAKSGAAALRVARTVATSNLVKTAMHGKDPNWGRIAGAVGRAGVPFNADRLSIRIGKVTVFERGQNAMTPARERAASKVMHRKRYTIEVDLAAGKAEAHYLTCDLGHAYVSVNADYRS